MNKSESINELAAALSAAQGELRPAPMNSVNPFLKNRYADIGAIIEVAKPVLCKHGLAVTQLVTGDGKYIGVETILLHSSGQWLSETVSLFVSDEKGKSDAQVAGSIITYMRRYALSAVLGMYADEDADGNRPAKTDFEKRAKPTINTAPPPAEWHGDMEQHEAPTPIAQTETASNGKGEPPTSDKGATFRDVKISTGKWKQMQVEIAAALPRYAGKDGKPNPMHILGALAAQGVRVIGDNTTAAELIAELKLRHKEEETV